MRWLAKVPVVFVVAVLAGCANHRGADQVGRNDLARFLEQYPRIAEMDSAAVEVSPEVAQILTSKGTHTHLAFNYLQYMYALGAGGVALDAIVAENARLHDLEQRGFQGLEGIKAFRKGFNDDLEYQRTVIQSMNFPEDGVTDVVVCVEGTSQRARGKIAYALNAKDRWVEGKMVERWHSQRPPVADCGPTLPTLGSTAASGP